MTVAIATCNRRDEVRRLLRLIAGEVHADPTVADAVDVVVVIDGSVDGTREELDALVPSFPVPLRVFWQPHRGLAAARNRGLEAARDVILFLDDDLVPADGLLARHLDWQRTTTGTVVVGPCRIPADSRTVPGVRWWWDQRFDSLAAQGEIRRFDEFTAANASGPAEVFRAAGGFDEGFVGYGAEDYELGVRLLAAAVPIRFDPDALAWHPQQLGVREVVSRSRSEGRNLARLADAHPETAAVLFPPGPEGRELQFLRHVALPWARWLRAVAWVATFAASHGPWALGRRTPRVIDLAVVAALCAGVAEADPDRRYLSRLLGRPSWVRNDRRG